MAGNSGRRHKDHAIDVLTRTDQHRVVSTHKGAVDGDVVDVGTADQESWLVQFHLLHVLAVECYKQDRYIFRLL